MGHLTDTSNRFEIKYLVPCREIPGLVAELDPYVYSDPNVDTEWGYPIYSVYWDSPDRYFFWEKIEGLKFRRKLRFRRYGEDSQVFLEIKQRDDRTLQKRRCRLPADRARELFEGLATGRGSLSEDEVDPVVAEAAVMCHRYRLKPAVAVRYRRRAFFAHFEPGLRITFDTRIQYRRAVGSAEVEPFDVGKYVIDPRVSVMEVKFTGRVPLWLARTTSRHGLQMVRMSKYCSAVDREFYGGQLT